MEWYWVLILCIVCVIVGAVIGFFGARWYFKKQMEEHPPIDERTIRVMLSQMGQKPSEARVRAIMNSIKTKK